MGIDSDTSSDSSAVMNGSKIRDIIKAYNAKASYSAGITDVWGVSVTVESILPKNPVRLSAISSVIGIQSLHFTVMI